MGLNGLYLLRIMRYYLDIEEKLISQDWLSSLPLTTVEEKVILALDGFYRLERNTLCRFKLKPGAVGKHDDYIAGQPLFYDASRWEKEGKLGRLPVIHNVLHITKKTYKVSPQLSLVIEKSRSGVRDFYFLSKLEHDDAALREAFSSFLSRLN